MCSSEQAGRICERSCIGSDRATSKSDGVSRTDSGTEASKIQDQPFRLHRNGTRSKGRAHRILVARYVIDASVAVEFLLRSPLGETVTDLLMNNTLFAPELFDIEVLAGLRRVVINGELSLEKAVALIDELVEWDIERVPHKDHLYGAWHYYRNVTAYDSVYLAIAEHLGVGVLTADSKLTRAPGINVEVHDLRNIEVLEWLETR